MKKSCIKKYNKKESYKKYLLILKAPADQPQQLVVGPGPAHCLKRKEQQIEHRPGWIVFLILSLYSYNVQYGM